MSTTSRIATNTIFLYLNVAVKALVSLYVTRLVLDALGASDYGIYNVVGGLISMLCFLNTSMASVTQRFMNYNQGIGDLLRLKSIFNISIVFHLAIAVIVVVMMVALKPVFFEHMLNIDADKVYAASCLYYFAMVSTAFTIMTVPYDAVLNSHENMRYYFYVGMVQSALNLLAAIYICNYHGERLIVYGFFMSAIAIITMIIMRVYCKRHYEECVFSPRKYYRKELFTDVFKYSGWEFVGHSSGTFFGWASNIVINKFFGTVVNAAAGISNQLSGQLQVLSSNLMKAVNPVMVKYESSGNRDKMFQMTISSCKLSLFCLFLVSIPFYAECDYILNIWLKSVPKGALLFCQLMVILRLIEQATLPLKTAIDAIGKVKWLNIFILFTGILQICMIYGFFSVGLPPYMWIVAMTIIAFVYSVYKVAYCACFAGMDWKQYVKEVVFRSVISYALPIVVSIAITAFFPSSFFRLIAVLVVSTLFCCTMFYLCGLNAMEKAEVNKLLCKIKNRIR